MSKIRYAVVQVSIHRDTYDYYEEDKIVEFLQDCNALQWFECELKDYEQVQSYVNNINYSLRSTDSSKKFILISFQEKEPEKELEFDFSIEYIKQKIEAEEKLRKQKAKAEETLRKQNAKAEADKKAEAARLRALKREITKHLGKLSKEELEKALQEATNKTKSDTK